MFGEDVEDESFASKDEASVKDSFDSDFGKSSGEEAPEEQEGGEDELLLKKERKENRKIVHFGLAGKQKKPREAAATEEADVEKEEKRRSKRLGDREPEPVKSGEQVVVKRPKTHKAPVIKGGSLSNEQFAGVTNESKNWQKLMQKPSLTPLEMMQEAAFTELINKQSLA